MRHKIQLIVTNGLLVLFFWYSFLFESKSKTINNEEMELRIIRSQKTNAGEMPLQEVRYLCN